MATAGYLEGRQKYRRPQAMLWSENPGSLLNDLYIPDGFEVGGYVGIENNPDVINQFLILSDDNRSPIQMQPQRIEKRERMINGRMRSYHIADKLKISVSWSMLPSRSYILRPEFDPDGGKSALYKTSGEYTTDGGAGGVELLDWYENHTDPFWVFLSYDKYNEYGDDDQARSHLGEYNDRVEMYLSDFNYTIVKRGGLNYDFWDISLTLEEV